MSRATKWVAAVVAVAGLMTAAGSASAAGPAASYTPYPFPQVPHNPGPFPPHGPRYDRDYVVYVKSGWHGGWRFHGRYETLHQAQRVETQLEHRGYRARIESVFGGGRRFPW